MSNLTRIILLTGQANPKLAKDIASILNFPLGNALISQFKDGESQVEILEKVQNQDVFILQPTSHPTNHHFMELLLMVDAVRLGSPLRITAIVPYFGYARQDKRLQSQVPISAKVCADLLATVGIDRIITVDLHTEALQPFFTIPIHHLHSTTLFVTDYLKKNDKNYPTPLIVTPDIGGIVRARHFANRLNNANLVILDKRRMETGSNKTKIIAGIGKIKDRNCIIVDDLIDTANTLCFAANLLKEQGAKTVSAYVTHPVLSDSAVENLQSSCLEEVVLTDTIPLGNAAKSCQKIRILSVAPMLANAIGESSLLR